MPSADFKRINALAGQIEDPDARELLLAEGFGLVQFVINWKKIFIKRFGDRDDLVQEGMIGYHEAMRDWDGRGRFVDWAIICVYRELITAVKTATRKKHQPLNEANTLDAPARRDRNGQGEGEDRVNAWRLRDLNGLGDDPADLVADRVGRGSLVDALCEGMADLERDVFQLCMLQSKSYREAAAILSKPEKSVDNALQRIRRKLMNRAAQLASDERISAGARAICARVAAGGGTQRRRIAS